MDDRRLDATVARFLELAAAYRRRRRLEPFAADTQNDALALLSVAGTVEKRFLGGAFLVVQPGSESATRGDVPLLDLHREVAALLSSWRSSGRQAPSQPAVAEEVHRLVRASGHEIAFDRVAAAVTDLAERLGRPRRQGEPTLEEDDDLAAFVLRFKLEIGMGARTAQDRMRLREAAEASLASRTTSPEERLLVAIRALGMPDGAAQYTTRTPSRGPLYVAVDFASVLEAIRWDLLDGNGSEPWLFDRLAAAASRLPESVQARMLPPDLVDSEPGNTVGVEGEVEILVTTLVRLFRETAETGDLTRARLIGDRLAMIPYEIPEVRRDAALYRIAYSRRVIRYGPRHRLSTNQAQGQEEFKALLRACRAFAALEDAVKIAVDMGATTVLKVAAFETLSTAAATQDALFAFTEPRDARMPELVRSLLRSPPGFLDVLEGTTATLLPVVNEARGAWAELERLAQSWPTSLPADDGSAHQGPEPPVRTGPRWLPGTVPTVEGATYSRKVEV